MGENIKKMSLIDLLKEDLQIPLYQRPYEWDRSNLLILLDDIIKEYYNNKRINLGTIILLNNGENKYDIVDGQQRIITLSLLCKTLDIEEGLKFIKKTKIQCTSNTKAKIISNNYEIEHFINRLKESNEDIDKFRKYIKKDVNFYVLFSDDEEEAFQLFDGRNSKYKILDPVDLLKAYHLRTIDPESGELKKALNLWNRNIKPKPVSDNNVIEEQPLDNNKNDIQYLFEDVLFNIYNWSLNKNAKPFTKDDIYLYKGYKKDNSYNYINYYKSTKDNVFIMNKPFKEGYSFFEMIDTFIKDYKKIKKEYNLFERIDFDTESKLDEEELKYTYKYISNVYYNALFMFENKFGKDNINDFERKTISDYIYKWSLIHRISKKQVNADSVNYYILKNDNFFYQCLNSLSVDELYKLNYPKIIEPAKITKDSKPLAISRRKLWDKLKD